jgi:uncharacterized protein YggE
MSETRIAELRRARSADRNFRSDQVRFYPVYKYNIQILYGKTVFEAPVKVR